MKKKTHDTRTRFYMNIAIWQSGLSTTAIAVFAYLSFCANRVGMCYPTVQDIAKHCSVCGNTVRNAIRELSDAGYVSVQPQFVKTPNGKRRQTMNLYHLLSEGTPDSDKLYIGAPVSAARSRASSCIPSL